MSDFFKNLEAIRLSPDSLASVGTTEIFTHLPVRKPNRSDFFRVHPDPQMSFATSVFIDKDEMGETYLVAPEMQAGMFGETKAVNLTLAVNRQGNPFLWAVPFPDQSGRTNLWTETARQAADVAKQTWIRMIADMSLKAYRLLKAEGALPDPIWPDKSFEELLELAFKDRVIESENHPVVGRLRGLA